MITVDYNFYTGTYGGGIIPQSAFNTYYTQAGIILDRLTYGHIQEEDGKQGQYIHGVFEAFTEAEENSLKLAICAIMDAQKRLDDYRTQALSGSSSEANIKSRTSGGESISYDTKATAYDKALTSETDKMLLMKSTAGTICSPYSFRHNPFYAGAERRWN